MKYPKLKQARLCRILTYVVVLGAFLLPMVLVCCAGFLPDWGRVLLCLLLVCGLIGYLFRNFLVLMFLDMSLASLSCYNRARTRYHLPQRWSLEQTEKRISHYGTKCAPAPLHPLPADLRYRFCGSMTVYARGIEKVVASYHTELLDANGYRTILSSAKTNSHALAGRKKPLFLDALQKNAALNRVTVLVIFARRVEEELSGRLYEYICKQCGDGFEDCVVPCVIDLEKRNCVFSSLRLPFVGFCYPVKNRGIRLVRKLVFGGRIRLTGNGNFPEPIKNMDPERSLWDFWRELYYECVLKEKETAKRFEAMADGQICLEEDMLYLKWEDKGICLTVEADASRKTVQVEPAAIWSYPKKHPIAKKTIRQLQTAITDYFSKRGDTVEFLD